MAANDTTPECMTSPERGLSLQVRTATLRRVIGAKYCGRGYVQLTWKANYAKAAEKLNVDLVGDPDLAMSKDIAALILRHGMREGWFTGKSFQSYLPAEGQANAAQFQAARRIINGTDKSALIAKYAMQFQAALLAGGWET